ncbi:MAG: HD domain-containing protein [Streptosporangiales bacterium]|nr:HD domain-containing protein [Streptosporangiales bacterium]
MSNTANPERGGWHGFESGQALLAAAAGLLAAAVVAQTAAAGLTQPRVAVAFGLLVALGELVRISLPGGRESAPIAAAGAIGYALLLSVGGVPAGHGAVQVIAVTAIGMIVGALPHVAVGRSPRLDSMARRLFAVTAVALCFRPLASWLPTVERQVWVILVVMLALLALAGLVDILIASMVRTASLHIRFLTALRDELRAQTALGVAAGATAVLIALATHAMGIMALLVFTAPLLVTQVAFRRYAGIRATYLQTIRALSRVTEVGGYVESGHSRRVSALAVGVGRELGMSEPDRLMLEYAALMHDIGQLSLRDPIPGGATVLAAAEQRRRIAEYGAEVIRRTGVLDHVVEIVRRQADPYCPDGVDTTLPLASRIIKAAGAYDDLVGSSADRDRQAAALERLRLDTVEYDPAVVEALSRVVERFAAASSL